MKFICYMFEILRKRRDIYPDGQRAREGSISGALFFLCPT